MKKDSATASTTAVIAKKKGPSSYTMLEPRFRKKYFEFYQEIYRPSTLDRKTKELVSIAASLASKCQGCIQGHIRKAIKSGATKEEISETIVIAMSVNAAAIVDLTDIAAANLGLEFFPTNGEPTSTEDNNGQKNSNNSDNSVCAEHGEGEE